MLIPVVEDGIEAFLRARLPLSREVGDVNFEAPSGTWAAQVNRVTVNLFLYAVSRSANPPRAAASRLGDDGRLEQRPALPMVQLSYMVSAWAGGVRDEHQLLGDVLTTLICQQVLPAEYVPVPLASNVMLTLAVDDVNRPRDIWSAVGGNLRASFTLLATVAADAYGWQPAAPGVVGVAGRTSPWSAPEPAPVGGPRGAALSGGPRTAVRRRSADGVVHTSAAGGTGDAGCAS